jgi:hypothetical protein
MIWWEREIYIKILIDYQEEKKQKEMSSQANIGIFNI